MADLSAFHDLAGLMQFVIEEMDCGECFNYPYPIKTIKINEEPNDIDALVFQKALKKSLGLENATPGQIFIALRERATDTPSSTLKKIEKLLIADGNRIEQDRQIYHKLQSEILNCEAIIREMSEPTK